MEFLNLPVAVGFEGFLVEAVVEVLAQNFLFALLLDFVNQAQRLADSAAQASATFLTH